MVDTDKKKFWAALNLTMELCQAFPLTKEGVMKWYKLLSKYELDDISIALDQWVDTQKRAPTPSDIKSLCQHKVTISPRLDKSSLSRDENKLQAEKVNQYIAKNLKPKTDYHSWFKRILRNPKNFPDDSVKEAKRVAVQFGYDLADLLADYEGKRA